MLRQHNPQPVHVAILGNGIAGITAALTLRSENPEVKITVISQETELFYSRTALMYIYMRDLRFSDTVVHPAKFYQKQRIDLKFTEIRRIDFGAKKLHTDLDAAIPYDFLLLAPGSRPKMPGVPGEDAIGVHGLYSAQDLDALEKQTAKKMERAVIVGGGLIGVELAEMLTRRRIPVTFLVRDSLYFSSVLPREEARLITDEIRRHGVDLRLDTEIQSIEHDSEKNVRAVITKQAERISCSLVGMTIGVTPRLELAIGTPLKVERGIVTNEFLETNLAGVFAAGDAAEVTLPDGKSQVQQLWYTGRMQGRLAGLNLSRKIAGQPLTAYDPGIFFNSAKFFSVEYQTYGQVPPTASQNDSLLWQHRDQAKLIRIAFKNENGNKIVCGFNVLGIRYRHEVCERWIREQRSLEWVLRELQQANFDPEFYKTFEANLLTESNAE